MGVGLCLNSLLKGYMGDGSIDVDLRQAVFSNFGTFSRTMITMMEFTMGNFMPVCSLLIEHVDEMYGHLVLVYKMAIGFAVISVIRGVFLHETFKAASSDDEPMVMQKNRAQKSHEKKMRRLFSQAHVSNEGGMQRSEFEELLRDDTVRVWLAAQDVDVGDANLLFDLMDDGDERLTPTELVKGVARLRGPARSLDLVELMHNTNHLSDLVSKLEVRPDGEIQPYKFPITFRY